MQYWLFKSEPETYGVAHLANEPNQTCCWDGVRNYQARNFMRDNMKVGDRGFFYHSNCKVPGIVGTVTIVKSAYPDHTAFDPDSPYFDPKSTRENPRWFMVDVKLDSMFNEVLPLNTLKAAPELEAFPLVKKGNRLSVMPVSADHWKLILDMVKHNG